MTRGRFGAVMPVGWMDVSRVPFNAVMLLERAQLRWLPARGLESEFAVALSANPAVEWFIRHKCPEISDWLDSLRIAETPHADASTLREAEVAILLRLDDLLVYALCPETYDVQPFLNWDSSELTDVVDFAGATVIDVGAGTGRLSLVAARRAKTVFAVEPVGYLRDYLAGKAVDLGFHNVFPVDGLITAIPFPGGFADVVVGGHVFGDEPAAEYEELRRVTRPGGTIVLCPGNNDADDERHQFLLSKGFDWSVFEEPRDGLKRKYWKRVGDGRGGR
ncbi:MAG: class I SAM-dependent methyltransferase [Dehalococcoidia bacterium]|nr:class I SAM-dependent methyltransferase [Dehalococcoidia bacterium]